MAVSFFCTEVSDLCLGKPALRCLSTSATVADALLALKQSEENYLSVWNCNHQNKSFDDCFCVGKVCMVDVVCFLCNDDNISHISSALKSPVSMLLPKDSTVVQHVDPFSSLLDVIDLIVDGAQNLVVPIKSNSRRKLLQKSSSFGSTQHNGHEFCWLTQEDIVRFLLSSIGQFSPFTSLSIESLGTIDKSILSVNYHDPLSSTTISTALAKQTSIAVVDNEKYLIGEISPFTLANWDETITAAITTLSAGDLMAYIDCGSPPPDYIIREIKARLHEKKLHEMVDLLEESQSPVFSSSSSSDDENSPTLSTPRISRLSRSGSYSARMLRTAEAIVCHPGSSLVAVMIQAIAHRINYVWVVEDDYSLAGIVTFAEILKVFREHFQSIE